MRLPPDQAIKLKQLLTDELGSDCELLLFGSRAERLLGGRRVDLLLIDPNTELQPIHRIALSHGVPLQVAIRPGFRSCWKPWRLKPHT